jgi:hypothetical protein
VNTTTAVAVAVIGLFGSVVGVLLTALLAEHRERRKQRTDFIERQLSELYGPLLSLRKRVTARCEFHRKITSAILKASHARNPELRKTGISDQQIDAVTISELNIFTDYDQKTLEDLFMPDYRKMIELFREKMWLVEVSTRLNFENLFEYVETWELFLRKVITGEVTSYLGQGESKLVPLYADLEQPHDRLRDELAHYQNLHLVYQLRRYFSAKVA